MTEITYVIKVTEFKFEVIFGLRGCLEAVVASEPAKKTYTLAVLIVDVGLRDHCPLVPFLLDILCFFSISFPVTMNCNPPPPFKPSACAEISKLFIPTLAPLELFGIGLSGDA